MHCPNKTLNVVATVSHEPWFLTYTQYEGHRLPGLEIPESLCVDVSGFQEKVLLAAFQESESN